MDIMKDTGFLSIFDENQDSNEMKASAICDNIPCNCNCDCVDCNFNCEECDNS